MLSASRENSRTPAMQLLVLLALLVPICSQFTTLPHLSSCSSKYEVRIDSKLNCSYAGDIDVCWSHNDGELHWHTVCASVITPLDVAGASIVCRQLGFISLTGHRPVIIPEMCVNGVSLHCPDSTAISVQNCSISEAMTFGVFGVICNVSQQEMQSCLSATSSCPTTTTSSCPTITTSCPTTTTLHQHMLSYPPIITPEAVATCDCFIPSSTPATHSQGSSGAGDQNQTSPNKATTTCHNCPTVLVGGVLGAVIGILAIVVVGLLIGWTYDHRHPKSHEILEGRSDSHLLNPTYDTTTSTITAAFTTYEQATPTTRSVGEEGTAGPLYNVLERPERKNQQTHQLLGREEEEEGCGYDVITTRNEDLQEDDYQEPQDHLRYDLVRAQSYEVPVQTKRPGKKK